MAASLPIFVFLIVAGAVAFRISTLNESCRLMEPLLAYGASAILGGVLLIAIGCAAWFIFFKVAKS